MKSILKHDQRSHYKNGGSVIARREACPGSLKMEEACPETTNEYADHGTAIHELIEELIPYTLKNWSREEELFNDIPKMLHADREDVESAKVACLDIIERIKKYGGHVNKIAWGNEQKFIIDESLELGGTVDFWFGYKEKGTRIIHAWDYKNGRTPVNCQTSMQLKQYLAAMQTTVKTPFDILYGHIFQPNSSNQNLNQEPAKYTAEEIEIELNRQKEIAKRALGLYGDNELKLRAGDHCFFCRAKTQCDEHHKWLNKNALYIFDTYDEKQALKNAPAVQVAKVIEAKPHFEQLIKKLNDEQIRNFVLHADYIKSTIKAAEEYVKNRAAAGTPIKGLKCVEATGRRGWKKSISPLEIGNQLKKIGIEMPFIKELRNIGDIEKELKTLGNTKDESKELISDLVEKGTPGINIIPDDDSDDRLPIEVVNAAKATELFDIVDKPKDIKLITDERGTFDG